MSTEIRAQNSLALTSVKAIKDATDESQALLESMRQSAEDAGTTLTGIYQDAEDAQASASSAKVSAETALLNLGLVEDIVGTVNWIALHGYYQASTDTAVNTLKTYFTVTATQVTAPSGNPHEKLYYELSNGAYVLSTDTSVDSGKTYYTITAVAVPTPTGSPSANGYYELNIDESVQQYIATHLALTEEGLRVTDGSASSLLINSGGVTIRGENGNVVGQYGEGAIIGDTTSYHLEITGQRLSFMNADTEVAYMTGDRLYIPRVVVVNSMQAGNWLWDASTTNYLTLRWNEGAS